MKLLGVVNLQEPQPSQYGVQFTENYKRIMKALGWSKGDGIAIYRHGAGFFLEKARGSVAQELALAKKEIAEPQEKEESSAKKKRGRA